MGGIEWDKGGAWGGTREGHGVGHVAGQGRGMGRGRANPRSHLMTYDHVISVHRTDCIFSPDEQMIVTGVSVKKEPGVEVQLSNDNVSPCR